VGPRVDIDFKTRFPPRQVMPHRKDRDEEWAIALLEQIVQRDREDRDALSGQAVGHIKRALVILKKRRASNK
jgi:hypothetical protein